MEEAKEPVVLSVDCICWRLEPPALSKSGGRERKMWMEARACQIRCWLAPKNGDRSEADVDQTFEKRFELFTNHLNTMNRQMVAGNAERTSFFSSPCWDVSK